MSSNSAEVQSNAMRYALVIGVIVGLLVGYQAWRYFSTPPKLQASADALKTLDAMFTALTARDSAKLAACMIRIEQHFAAGKLGRKATDQLRYCAELANKDSWDNAAKHLYWMIYKQPY